MSAEVSSTSSPSEACGIGIASSSCSSNMSQPNTIETNELNQLMSDGKRHYFCAQPQQALECFVKLCEKLSLHYGQESHKCMEAYLYYGKTLLEIARLEGGVFGQAIKETTTGDDGDDSDVEITDEKPTTTTTNGSAVVGSSTDGSSANAVVSSSTTVPDSSTNGSSTTHLTNGDSKVSTTTTTTTAVKNSEEDPDDDEAGGDEDEEDVTNMELSWEMFELVTVICKRGLQDDPVVDEKNIRFTLAEAKNGLAQVSLETEQYEEAVRDFRESLDIYKQVLDPNNDRVLAETHYNIALALSFDKKFQEAITEFESAVAVLKSRVGSLESKITTSTENASKTDKASSEVEDWKKEVSELNDLIEQEMLTRIEDAKESQRLAEQSIKTMKTAASDVFSAFGGTANKFDTGFDAGFGGGGFGGGDGDAAGFDSPAFGSDSTVNDCTMNIKSLKRKTADEEGVSEMGVKK